MDNEKIKQFITSQRQAGIPDAEIHAYLVQKGAIQMPKPEVAPKPDGFIKTIAKDVASTLLVKPAARATEAATRVFAPNSLAAQGFESMADSGQGQNIGGIEIPQQEAFGQGGGRQIASDTLKTASYLFPYGKAATAIGGATGSKIAGNVISGAVGGYTADVGYNLEDTNKTIGESMIPGAGTAIGAAIPLVGPAVRGAGRATAKLGSKTGELAIPISSREAQILQTYKANNPFFKRVGDVLAGTEKAPTTAGKTAVKEGIIGTKSGIGVQAKRASDTLWKDVISPRLKESDQAVDLDGFFAKVEGDIIAKNPEISRQKALLEALEAYKEDYSGTKVVTLEQLQKFKEGWAQFVPEKAYKGKPIAGAFNAVRNELANEARTTIYSQLGDDVKQAYFDYGNLQGLKELGQVAMTGSKLKGGAGSFTSEILSRAVTPVATVGGQAIYRVGKGIEFIGNLGAKNLGEALGIKGGMKFPGDKAIDDIKKTFGQDASLPMSTQSSQIPTSVKSSSISPNSTTKGLKGKSGILEKLNKDQRGFIASSFKNEGNLTTKILKDLEGKTTVSKQYILDATNRGELKQVERDITRQVLDTMPDGQINVKEFADKVKSELLPLKVKNETFPTTDKFKARYENITLPDELRGAVKNYKENIYESPIKTSAGYTHFDNWYGSKSPENYFGHTRIEDMADNKTRRVIEVQSDLYQKGNLENKIPNKKQIEVKVGRPTLLIESKKDGLFSIKIKEKTYKDNFAGGIEFRGKKHYLNLPDLSIEEIKNELPDVYKKIRYELKSDVEKLQQYNDPTAHFRMVREEIKKASQDGKTKLQFPTGETAMKIEGLGENVNFYNGVNTRLPKLTPQDLKVGKEVYQNGDTQWIITDVLGDGKFKAVSKDRLDDLMENAGIASDTIEPTDAISYAERHITDFDRNMETFDISGKVDTNNPIYKFYEKDVQKYLNKFGGKRVIDDKGVSWIEIPITKEQGINPVEAFGKIKVSPLIAGAGLSLAGAIGAGAIKKKKNGQ